MMTKKTFILLILVVMIGSCSKEPTNPYGGVNYNTDTTTSITVDANTIVGLHHNIFFPHCAKSGCHDGTFEPDYRTVMSTYSTLVYQPVIKNHCGDDTSQYFKLRVIPFNADSSFLIERLTTSTSDYMPSNGNRLTDTEIGHIRTWINNGAKDENGNTPVAPNLPPVVNYIYPIDQNPPYPADTNRLGGIPYNPLIIHPGQNIYVLIGASDDSTAYADLTLNQMRLSYNRDDFSSATTVNAIYFLGFWAVPILSNNYTPNDTVFFRYYVNDGDHVTPTEYPRDDYPFYYKLSCSFIVQ